MSWNKIKFEITQKYPLLRKYLDWNSGYIHEPFKDSDRVFGNYGSVKTILQEGGDWRNHLPSEERQNMRGIETYGCVSFSLNNAVEMIAKKKFGETWDKSDRYLATTSGTGQYGNSMEAVYQALRKTHGAVDESEWPWGMEVINRSMYFMAVKPEVIAKGKSWLDDYEVSVETVPQNLTLMKEALKYSPLWVSGYAWYHENGIYKSYGRANHCFTVVAIDNDYIYAFDTYPPFIKKLSKDYLFGDIKTVLLNKRPSGKESEIKKLLDRGFKYIMRVQGRGEIYQLVNQQEIKYVDPTEWNNLAVKEAVNNKKLVPIDEVLYNKIS